MLSVTLETNLWNSKLDEGDIKLLHDVEAMTNTLISQVYVSMDLLKQYIELVEQTSIFTADVVQEKNDDMSDAPTQTATDPAPANRADRRAREKKKTPFDVIQGTK